MKLYKAEAAAAAERLVAAAAAGDLGDLRLLLARTSVDCCAPEGRFKGQSPLMVASEKGRLEAVELLIEKKASSDSRDASGWTPLMHAIFAQRPDVVKLMLHARANAQAVAETDGKVTPLILAASASRLELVKLLLASGASKEMYDCDGCRPLHHAARRGNGGAVLALIEAKAKIEAQDQQGFTPLLAAVSAGRAECVRLLLSHGANGQAVDFQQRTAKSLATTYEHDRVLKVLAEGGG